MNLCFARFLKTPGNKIVCCVFTSVDKRVAYPDGVLNDASLSCPIRKK